MTYEQAFSNFFVASLALEEFKESNLSGEDRWSPDSPQGKCVAARLTELEKAVSDAEAELAKFPPPAAPRDND